MGEHLTVYFRHGQVTDGFAQGTLRRDLRLRFLYPVFQLSQQWQAAVHAGNLTIFVVTSLSFKSRSTS